MGLFSKKENDKEKAPAPPGPPKPAQNNSTGSPLPPPPGGKQMPPSPPSGQNNEQASSTQSNTSYGAMPEPPSPMGGLDEIKNQISTPNVQPAPSSSNVPAQKQEEASTDDLESLFDFSDLDEQIQNSPSKNTQITHEEPKEEELPQQREHSEEELTFLKTRDTPHSKHNNESIYITTSQFKALLEIVEEVKLKAKDSSERHLRLLDIKSEEDIEFENLKKDFAFIEDKLYEVDNLIFER